MNSFIKHLRLIWPNIKIGLKSSMEFKSDFILTIFAQIVYLGLAYFVAFVITTAIPKLGLTALELFLYTTTIDHVFGILRSSQENIVNVIVSGRLNAMLVRPVNILFQIYFMDLSVKYALANFINIIIIACILINTHINPLFYLFIIIVTILIGIFFFQGGYLLIRALDVKKLHLGSVLHRASNENNITGMMATYPLFIFPKIALIYVAFLPVYYVGNTLLNIINHVSPWQYILILGAELIIAIIFLIAAHYAWKRMLKYYEGFGG